MKKLFKKTTSLLLALVLILSIAPMSASALTAEETLNYLSYEIEDGEVTVNGCRNPNGDELIIPDTIEGYPVTTIGKYAFSSGSKITKLTLPDTIQTIENHAFNNCAQLTEINIPKSLKNIGDTAFYYCYFDKVEFDENNPYLSYESYTLFSKDKTELIRYIGPNNVSNYVVNENVKVIKPYAFAEVKMNEITLNDGLETIQEYAFYYSALTSLDIPDSVTTIEDGAFFGNSELASIKFGAGLKKIGEIFSANNVITELTIPDTVEAIGSEAFNFFRKLETVNLSSGVKNIESQAFRLWVVKEFTVAEDNENFATQDGVLFNKDKTELVAYPDGRGATTYTVPENVEKIGAYSFYETQNATNVVFTQNVSEIGEYAFAKSKIATVNLPDNIKKVGDYAYVDCLIKDFSLGNGVEYIGDCAFWDALAMYDELKQDEFFPSIIIPASVKHIGARALMGYERLALFIEVDPDNQHYVTEDNILFDKAKKTLVQYSDFRNNSLEDCRESYTVPDSVEVIGEYAFYGDICNSEITLGKNVKVIGENAFRNSFLRKITFNDGLETIGEYAFSGVDIDFNLPDSVTTIDKGAFSVTGSPYRFVIPPQVTVINERTFNGYQEVVIPVSVKKICRFAFDDELWCVYYEGNVDQWNEIELEAKLYGAIIYYDSFTDDHEHTGKTWTLTKKPTCTEVGVETRFCTVCRKVLEERTVKANGHQGYLTQTYHSNDCTINGKVCRVCSVCDEVLAVIQEPVGHQLGEWEVKTPADCDENGVEARYCTVCKKEIETREIAALGHTAGDWVVTTEPTCIHKGEKTLYCATCNEALETSEVDITDHTQGEWVVTKSPSYTQSGEMTLYCSVCGKIMETKIIDKVTSEVVGVRLADITLNYKDEVTLFPTVSVEGRPSYTVSYSVEDDSVASIVGGKLTGLKRGTTNVTVSVTDTHGNVYQDNCKVEVKLSLWQWIIEIFLFGWLWY